MTKQADAPLTRIAYEVLIPFCLLLFFFLLAPHFLGLSLADNTAEILHGEVVTHYTFFHFVTWSPLYSLWLHALAYLVPDPLHRYYVSWAIFAASLALLPTMFGVRGAWLYGMLLAVAPLLVIGPFNGPCGSALLVLGLCVVLSGVGSLLGAAMAACLTSFVVAFIRPECTYGTFLCAVAVVVIALSDRGSNRARRVIFTASAVVLSGVLLIFLAHTAAKRSGIAVSQHYDLWAEERGLLVDADDFWNADYAARAFHVDPAKVQNDTATVGDFARGNPRLYLDFVLHNLFQVRTLVLLTSWCVLLSLPWLRVGFSRLRPASLFIALVTVPGLAGVLLIAPRWHYQLQAIPCLLLFAMQVMPVPRPRGIAIPAIIVFCCCLIYIVEVRVVPARVWIQPLERRDLARVACLRAADEETALSKTPVFDGSRTGVTYLKRTRVLKTPDELPQWQQLQAWIHASHPAWLASDGRMASRYGVTTADLASFMTNDEAYGPFPCATDANIDVYIRRR